MIFGAILFFVTCERNDLYDNHKDYALSVVNLGLDSGGAAAPTAIYIYRYTGGTVQGSLGGRAGADALCQSIAPPASTTVVHAFLSVSTADQVRDLVPLAYQVLPVYDGTGTNLISTTWALMWDGSIDQSLSNAGVLGGGAEWWNGSFLNGTYNSASSCDGGLGSWTTNSNAFTGQAGNSNAPTPLPDANWIIWSQYTCNTITNLLCVAY